MLDCRSTQAMLQRAVTGAPVEDGELEQALGHLLSCTACGRRFAPRTAGASTPVSPEEIPERALVVALEGPDALARRRAAVRLGERSRLGVAARTALADAAAGDPDGPVRAAAAAALAQAGSV